MDLHEQQQFDFLLQTAVERLALRLMEQCRGAEPALERLGPSEDEPAEPVLQFVDALFADFLLDNAAGACFILQGMASAPVPLPRQEEPASVEQHLVALAKAVLARLLHRKVRERLAQMSMYQGIG